MSTLQSTLCHFLSVNSDRGALFASTQEAPTSEKERCLVEEMRVRDPVFGTVREVAIDLDMIDMYGVVGRKARQARTVRRCQREAISKYYCQNLAWDYKQLP